jgi:hypothetical protein
MATSSKKIQLSYPTISVSAPIFIKGDKSSMFSRNDKYEIRIANSSLEFPTKKEADVIYNEIKNFKNEKQYLEFFQSYLLRRIPQRAFITSTFKETRENFSEPKLGQYLTIENFYKVKRGTYFKFEHDNFGKKRMTEFVFDSTINDRVLGWMKIGDNWEYGDSLYNYENKICAFSGAEILIVKEMIAPPNKFELPNLNEAPKLSKKTEDDLYKLWDFVKNRKKRSDKLLEMEKQYEEIKPFLSKLTIDNVPTKIQALVLIDAKANRMKKVVSKEQVEKTIQNIWNDYYSGKDTFAYGGAMAKNYDYGGDFESPRIYIVNLEDYNNNIDGGVWLHFSDYENADELMNDIQNWLDEWGVEEYEIIDGEYLPAPMGMDVSDLRKANFVEIYTLMDVAKEKGISIDDAYEEVYGENESFAKGGAINWQKYPTKKVRGLYEIKGDGINRKVNIVFFERYDDDLYSLYPLDKDKHLFREILVKSTALNSLDKGVSVQGETNDGKKVSIKRLSNQDFSYAKGGGLNRSLVSGTSGRWVADLPHAKYKITKEVKNAQANGKNNVTYTNIVLPKGSIVHNLSGGVFVENEKLKEKYSAIYKEKYGLPITRKEETLTEIYNNSEILEYAKGGSLIGNQKRIDLNKNGKIDAEDFKLLRTTMNGAWRNDHQHVNSTSRKDGKLQDYEVIYARKHKSERTGYKGKTNFADGGNVDRFSEYSNDALTDMIINLSRYENTESDIQMVKDELKKRKGENLVVEEEVTYFLNKDGIKVRSKVEPKVKLSEAEWMAKHSESKEARGYAKGGAVYNKSKYLTKEQFEKWNDYVKTGKINGKKEDNMFAVARHIGTSVPKINAYEIEQRSKSNTFANGGGVGKISFEDWLKKNNIEVYKRTYYWVADDGGNDYMYSGSKGEVMKSLREDWKKSFAKGGAFEKLSDKVAKNYEGKRVKPQYQKEYGKVYSKSEAKEVGDKVAGKVKANQKMVSGGETKKGARGGIMTLAKKIRKDGEKWTDAVKRAGQQLK